MKYNFGCCGGLGLPLDSAYLSSWYAGLCQVERRYSEMENEEPFADDPSWLALPVAKRELALFRRSVIADYEKHEKPGDAEVQAAARELGITASHFYRILRKWRKRRSVFSLVPFSDPSTQSHARLAPEVVKAVNHLITTAINTDGMRSPAAILKKIQSDWDLPQPIPSHMTLRKGINRGLQISQGLSEDSVTLSKSTIPQEAMEEVEAFGDVICIDHVTAEMFVLMPYGIIRPAITLAIDLFTRSIVASYWGPDKFLPRQTILALHYAERGTRQFAKPGVDPVRPRVVLAATHDADWVKVIEKIRLADIDAHVRQSATLQSGGIVARLIGNEIGKVKFSHRKARKFRDFDPKKDALVDPRQFDYMLIRHIEEFNKQRIGVEGRELRFDLPPG